MFFILRTVIPDGTPVNRVIGGVYSVELMGGNQFERICEETHYPKSYLSTVYGFIHMESGEWWPLQKEHQHYIMASNGCTFEKLPDWDRVEADLEIAKNVRAGFTGLVKAMKEIKKAKKPASAAGTDEEKPAT